ncbi:hypothetical protein B0O80DRAFT_458694 [Mortierella sp. GBAus27b]|nr:hypothetical protein B0O80DRAFT_458694 [Mortierella sp. GBAus27b]
MISVLPLSLLPCLSLSLSFANWYSPFCLSLSLVPTIYQYLLTGFGNAGRSTLTTTGEKQCRFFFQGTSPLAPPQQPIRPSPVPSFFVRCGSLPSTLFLVRDA